MLSGNIEVESRRGKWRIGLRVEEAQDKNQVRLTTVIQDLYPEAIADAMPEFKALNQFRFPISAKADYVLSSKGQILGGIFDIALGSGTIQMQGLGKQEPAFNSGRS